MLEQPNVEQLDTNNENPSVYFELYRRKDFNQSSVSKHIDGYYEFYFVLAGEAEYHIDGRVYSVKRGDVILVRPQQTHFTTIKTTSETPYERYALFLSPTYFTTFETAKTSLSFPFNQIKDKASSMHLTRDMLSFFVELLQKIEINQHSSEYGSDLLQHSYLLELMVCLSRLRLYESPLHTEADITGDKLINKALTYISNNITQELSLDQVASHLFVSKAYLSREFTKLLGVSLCRFITKKKLFLARQEMNGSLSIQEVAGKYGFGDYSSFFRAFKKEFGLSPNEYKRSDRGPF